MCLPVLKDKFAERAADSLNQLSVLFSVRGNWWSFPSWLFASVWLSQWEIDRSNVMNRFRWNFNRCIKPSGHKWTHQRKKGSQHARNADMMMPRVLAAFRSLFILLLLVIGGSSGWGSGDDWSTVGKEVKPAEIPLICKCLLRRAAATLLLEHKQQSNQSRWVDWEEKMVRLTNKSLLGTNLSVDWTDSLYFALASTKDLSHLSSFVASTENLFSQLRNLFKLRSCVMRFNAIYRKII